MTIAQAKDAKFGIGVCSLCDGVAITYGQQKHGGVRYCRECFQQTLSWVQIGAAAQPIMLALYNRFANDPKIAKQLAKGQKTVSPELAHAIGMGESRRRLFESERP